MIVNRKACDFTNIPCHFETGVTKAIHAIMEMEERSLRESEESEKQRWQKLYGDMTFVDDVHEGKARGYEAITTRWVDTNKEMGDEDNYRSRLV